jgi:hypothetical protein
MKAAATAGAKIPGEIKSEPEVAYGGEEGVVVVDTHIPFE